jgi:serralysin
MGRTLTLTEAADQFVQGFSPDNIEITLLLLGGDDVVRLDRNDDFGGGNIVEAGAGNDAIINQAENGSQINLGDGNDRYFGLGFGSFSADRADIVTAGAGNDFIAVSTFKSRYFGQAGNDQFFTVGWQNTFVGGAGIDTISYEPRDDGSTLAGSGVTVDLAAERTQTGANRFETISQIENVIGCGSDDAIFGNNGSNRLTGGKGFDQITGRGGADRFCWRAINEARVSASGIDLVTDFNRNQQDLLDLSRIDANNGLGGNQAFSFIAGAPFSGQAGQLRFSGKILSGDINGDLRPDFRIGLAGVTSLILSDIVL